MIAQVVGAVVGGLLLYIVTEGGDIDKTGVFAANGWGEHIGSPFGIGSVIVVEILFTALLVFVVLSTTTEGYPSGFGGIAAGLTLGMIHIATIPVDNTSVNPARSIGTACSPAAMRSKQLWAFIVFPLVGGARRMAGPPGRSTAGAARLPTDPGSTDLRPSRRPAG